MSFVIDEAIKTDVENISEINGVSKTLIDTFNGVTLQEGWIWRDVAEGWDYTLSISSNWITLDLSNIIPNGTVGVMIRLWNDSTDISVGVRKDATDTCSLNDGNKNADNYVVGMIACTTSRTIQYNIDPITGATEAYLSILAYKIG